MDSIATLLKTFEDIGINPIIIVAVIFSTTLLKSFDTKNKFKQSYVIFPLLASMVFVYIMGKPAIGKWFIDSCIHAAIGAYGYNIYSNLIRPKKKE